VEEEEGSEVSERKWVEGKYLAHYKPSRNASMEGDV
jgi:hypothetical protein